MAPNSSKRHYLEHPFSIYFLIGLFLVNFVADFQIDPLYIGSFFSFIYVLVTPGFLLLPFLVKKKLTFPLGLVFSITLSVLALMLVGLLINSVLPLVGITQPLATVPVLITFDLMVYALLALNYFFKKDAPFAFHSYDGFNWLLLGICALLPVIACIGAIILNDGGSDFFAMLLLALIAALVAVIIWAREKVMPSIAPIALYFMAASLLLTNSMRGWFITGHDILLEFHVFTLTNNAHVWNMAFYQDPYMACLSLTILPTFLESLLHVGPAYIFKFFIQFIGALPVVAIYYLCKEYVSEKIAFLSAFLYISFPTFMVDMAFLNRQGIAFLFFALMLVVLFSKEHFSGWARHLLIFMLGVGVILSHYSTSYITIALLLSTYLLNWIFLLLARAKKPRFLVSFVNRLGNKEAYLAPVLLTWPLVVGLFVVLVFWSSVITKTSSSVVNTIQQIAVSVEHPFSLEESTGPAQYSLFVSNQPTPQQLFNTFVKTSVTQQKVAQHESAFYPTSVTNQYPTSVVSETIAPLTPFGQVLQHSIHVSLTSLYDALKQVYAKVLQVLLLIGLIGLGFGYMFRTTLSKQVSREFIALSLSGIIIMIGQTVLPADAIDYGLLRLFQQNLIFLALPIILGLFYLAGFVLRSKRSQLLAVTAILLIFFIILSGFFTQLTGGDRPLLPLNNTGLYYDSYYTHTQEVYSAEWLAANGDHNTPIQAAHFSDIKMLAYGHIGAVIELLPQTTKKQAYVYLNYFNVQTSNVLEIVNGDIVYYHFPIAFLTNYKNLIYNNGGSQIYR